MMDGFRLTAEEIRSLRALHRRCKDRQWADRIKAVVLLGTGWTVTDTAEALLRRLEARPRKAKAIYVYCDNARYYRSRLVQAYLPGSKIKLIFLTAYCPNLNLIERL